jgi:hypothetical protein
MRIMPVINPLISTKTETNSHRDIEYSSWRGAHRSRNRLLAEIRDLSDDDYISPKHAAAYLDTSPGQLANLRMQRRGPPYIKITARRVRYKIVDLRVFMLSGRKATTP